MSRPDTGSHENDLVQRPTTFAGEVMTDMNKEIARLLGENEMLRAALNQSVKLQSHYATLLNEYDGGHRLTFGGAGDWLARLDILD